MTPASISPLTLAFLERKPDWPQAILFIIIGFCVVLGVLLALGVVMSVTGAYFKGQDAKEKAAKAAAKEQQRQTVAAAAAVASTTQAPAATDDSHLVAVIAAAAHAILGRNARIVSVKPASREWSAEGRRQIFASHRVR